MAILLILAGIALALIVLSAIAKTIFFVVATIIVSIGALLYGLCLFGFFIGAVTAFLIYNATSHFIFAMLCGFLVGAGIPALLLLRVKKEVCTFFSWKKTS